MRNLAAFIIAFAVPASAAAQPGGSDMPLGAIPAAQDQQPTLGEPNPHPQPEAQPPQPQGPQLPDPANAMTRATFVSTSEQPWDVWVDRTAICATPCTLGLNGVNFVALKTQERHPIRLDVGYLPQGDLIVSGKPMREGMYAGGIVATSFAGMALVTGVTLTAIGFGADRDGMKTAGLITGGIGAIGLYGGIALMKAALPKVSIGPAQPYAAPNAVGVAGNF